ncbi:MAG: 6,7-dimethyl-8-ribityllumazine synthase [Spirochaetaceae bacterium]
MKVYEGSITAVDKRIAIVVSRFNSFITERLLEGTLDCIRRHGGSDDNLALIRVPGSWEIPMVAKRAAGGGRFDAVICLGAVIRGDTPHFDYVAAEVSKGIAAVSLETGVPVSYGVLTTDTVEQATDRAGTKAGNKGFDAALGALEMADLSSKLD